MLSIKDLTYITIKGEGYFCIVKLYEDKQTGLKYALKELKSIHYERDDYRYRFNREIEILSNLKKCDNIIKLISYGQDATKNKLWLLMPYASQNLYHYIKEHNNNLSEATRFNILAQIINAIKFAHKINILHRDISPSNVLVFEDTDFPDNIKIMVSDFGLGKDSESLSYYTKSSVSGYGQILYVAPEQREQLNNASMRSDIYSLGKLTYFVFTGKDPDNIKQFSLSSLISKATELNPEKRFQTMEEFEDYFNALKELRLNEELIEPITAKDLIQSAENLDLLQLHQVLLKGEYINHVYDDYLGPVTQYLLRENTLNQYYQYVGNNIREFIKICIERLHECYTTNGWPFDSLNNFGKFLKKFLLLVEDDEARLACLKELWYIAFVLDQWSVQRIIKDTFNRANISSSIETQLAQYITQTAVEVDEKHYRNLDVQLIIKGSIKKANENAVIKKIEDERKRQEEIKNLRW